ncbi:hypothetical protein JOC36_001436 [Weissella uvarum]|uniref:VaFE repeat-containing surface-anchored protein n=1 Tax=Weissella uvarum TaxID=1479233 RepID=UPI001961A792|nr:VaFE repeat-containing surface-anchored protein [Weissella uvarum]MBM7617843.1 hypothetical protein [Weissella uvarum]MCM0596159.1 VaFE repeat-containing surface-anchored protein [Weissella uvarum]
MSNKNGSTTKDFDTATIKRRISGGALAAGALVTGVYNSQQSADAATIDMGSMKTTDKSVGSTEGLPSQGSITLSGDVIGFNFKGKQEVTKMMHLNGNIAYCLELSAQNPDGVGFKPGGSASDKSNAAIFQAINLGYPNKKGSDYGVTDTQLYAATQGLVWILSDSRGSAQVTNRNLKFDDPKVEALIDKLLPQIKTGITSDQAIKLFQDSITASEADQKKALEEMNAKAKKDAEDDVERSLNAQSKTLIDSIKYNVERIKNNNKPSANDGLGHDEYDNHDYKNGSHTSSYKINYSANSALKLSPTSKITFDKALPAGSEVVQNGKKLSSSDNKTYTVNNNANFEVKTPFSNDAGKYTFTAEPSQNATGKVSATSEKTGKDYTKRLPGKEASWMGIQSYEATGPSKYPDGQATIQRPQDIMAAVKHTTTGKPIDIVGKGKASGTKDISVSSKGNAVFQYEKMFGVPTLRKVDQDGKPLKNTLFQLWTLDDKGAMKKKVGEYASDSNGFIVPGADGTTNEAGNKDVSAYAKLPLGTKYAWKEIQSDGKHKTDTNLLPGTIDRHHVLWGDVTARDDQFTLVSDKAVNELDKPITEDAGLESKASFANGAFEAPAGKNQQIKDKLIGKLDKSLVNKELTVKTTLMDKSTRKPLEIDGKPVIITRKFTPKTQNLDYEAVVTNLDTSKLAGKTIVLYEDILDENGKTVGKEHDLGNEDQTLRVLDNPKIRTVATSDKGDKTVNPLKNSKLNDRVEYHNLVPGKKYQLKAELMDTLANKPLMNNGKPVVATIEFVAEKADGVINVPVNVDISKLAGKKTTFFETLIDDGDVVAEFKDIKDKDETVDVSKPEMGTTATGQSGNHVDEVTKNGTINDNVKGSGIQPGDYELHGTLKDKKTGKDVLDKDGKPVQNSKNVTVSKDGKLDVDLPLKNFDASKPRETVVFEELTTTEENGGKQVVAEHKDLKSASQTVEFKEDAENNPETAVAPGNPGGGNSSQPGGPVSSSVPGSGVMNSTAAAIKNHPIASTLITLIVLIASAAALTKDKWKQLLPNKKQ